jgi:hypothetical protein
MYSRWFKSPFLDHTPLEILYDRPFRKKHLPDLTPQLTAGEQFVQGGHPGSRQLSGGSASLYMRYANCGLKLTSLALTKLICPVLGELRRLGHRVLGNLDHICQAMRMYSGFQAASAADCQQAGREMSMLCSRLGLTIQMDKADSCGSTWLKCLGITLDGKFLSPVKL